MSGFISFKGEKIPILTSSIVESPNSMDIYSEEEQIVGIWVDGKPIYRKTIPFSVQFSGNQDYVLWNTNEIDCYIHGHWFGGFVANNIETKVSDGRVVIYNSDVAVKNNVTGGTYMFTGAAVIEYTKTTDAPIGISKNPYPYRKVYSTEEQIIGKWIDDQPLYSRTYVSGINGYNVDIAVIDDYNDLQIHEFYGVINASINDVVGINHINSDASSRSQCFINSNGILNINHNNPTFIGGTVSVTIEYTKTTNEAQNSLANTPTIIPNFDIGIPSVTIAPASASTASTINLFDETT